MNADFQEAMRRMQMGIRCMQASAAMFIRLKQKEAVFRGYAEHHRREAEAGSDNVRETRLKKAAANERHADDLLAIITYVETGDASAIREHPTQPG